VLAGHVHKPQAWQCGTTDIRYCGSPFRTAFGETEEKSIVMADWDPKAKRWNVTTIPTPARQMLLLEGEWGTFEHGGDGWIGEDIPTRGIDDAEIRFRYRVESDKRDAARADADKLRDDLLNEGAYSVKIEERVIARTRARAPDMLSITEGPAISVPSDDGSGTEATATTASVTERQLDALWRARNENINDERRTRLFDKCAQIESDAA
jgi:hypothetical protein